MAKVIEGLYYSESHEYVKVEGDFAYVGITDYAQQAKTSVLLKVSRLQATLSLLYRVLLLR